MTPVNTTRSITTTNSTMSTLGPEKALIFRITHIENVPWILKHGLHCRSSENRDPNFREIGNPDLIDKRRHRKIDLPPGGTLADYIPFYFTPHSPMLLNIKTGCHGMRQTPMSDIVIFVSSLRTLAERKFPFVFTDRHAYLQTARFFTNLSDLNALDWPRLRARDFRRDPDEPDKFERYQAEALVHQHLPVDALLGIGCHGAAHSRAPEWVVELSGRFPQSGGATRLVLLMIRYIQGNLLEASAEALINTVNEVGVMGKGVALMFREAFPENTRAYEAACKAGEVRVGRMFVTRNADLMGPRWIINFPTKQHWRHPSRLEWVQEGLRDLVRVLHKNGIRSVALPALGCGNGGLEWTRVRAEIETTFQGMQDVDILVFEPARV